MCPMHASVLAQYQELCVSWQVKAHLRGDSPPLSAQQLDVVLDMANTASRELLGALPLLPCTCCMIMCHMCLRNCMFGAEGSRILMSHMLVIKCHATGAERAAASYWLAHYFAAAAPGTSWPGELVCWVRQETGRKLPNTPAALVTDAKVAVEDMPTAEDRDLKGLMCCCSSCRTRRPLTCRHSQGHPGHRHRGDGAHQPPGVPRRARAPEGAVC